MNDEPKATPRSTLRMQASLSGVCPICSSGAPLLGDAMVETVAVALVEHRDDRPYTLMARRVLEAIVAAQEKNQ